MPEYYVTRTEIDILDRNRAEIASYLGPNIQLIGLGTGAGTKTRILIEALQKPAAYIPVDISEKQLHESTELFRKIFPELEILPVCADYLQPVVLPSPRHKAARNIVYFPGSTIGNFEPDQAVEFLRRIANVCRKDGGLLIGADLKKDRRIPIHMVGNKKPFGIFIGTTSQHCYATSVPYRLVQDGEAVVHLELPENAAQVRHPAQVSAVSTREDDVVEAHEVILTPLRCRSHTGVGLGRTSLRRSRVQRQLRS